MVPKIVKDSKEYDLFMKTALGYVFVVNKKGKILDINENSTRDFGYKKEEVIGKNISRFVPVKSFPLLLKDLALDFIGKYTPPREIPCKTKKGDIIYLKTAGDIVQIIDHKNKVIGIIVSAVNISDTIKAEKALKKSEEAYRNIFENTGTAMITFEDDKIIKRCNSKFEELSGYPKKEIENKLSWEKIVSKKDLARMASYHEKRAEGKKAPQEYEFSLITKSGKSKEAFVNISIIPETKKRIVSIIDVTELKQAKKALKEYRSMLKDAEKKINLTEKEKIVLYGLTRWPELNDNQLAKKIKVKRSTITSIKNKLRKKEYYRILRIPSCGIIGCSILAISKHKFSADIRNSNINDFPELVYHVSSERDSIGISVARDFAELRENLEKLMDKHENKRLIKDLDHVYFPVKNMDILRFFDFSFLLKHMFHLDLDGKKQSFEFNKKPIRLTKKERLVLYALVKYPEYTDTRISKITKISRATVSKLRKYLLDKKYLKTVVIPNAKKLGIAFLILTHSKLAKKYSLYKEMIAKSLEHSPQTFLAMSNSSEFVNIGAYSNYTEYKEIIDLFLESANKMDFLEKNPEEAIISLRSLQFKKIDFSGITKKALGIKKDI